MNNSDKLSALFSRFFGVAPDSVTPLPGAGSSRRYYRLSAPTVTAIGVVGDDLRENESFVRLSALFHSHGVSVPQVFIHSDSFDCYIQSDLGSVDLFSILSSDEGHETALEVMRSLPRMQCVPEQDWSDIVASRPFGPRLVGWDLNYFKYEFLKPSGILFDEEKLEDDFQLLSSRLCSLPDSQTGFMWRDCQSRNVMVADGKPWFIDFQGGRRGPVLYDAVSFAWQARAGFPLEFRKQLLAAYAESFKTLRPDCGDLLSLLGDIVLFRLLQVLGAYGFRGLVEKKSHFIVSIPQALYNLEEAAEMGWIDSYPEIRRLATALASMPRFAPDPADGKLRLKVFSFSYKKGGYPEDLSGNGGGFMFDCRSMHNPGRYAEYKTLTGRDRPVIVFLEERGEVQQFVEKAASLVLPAAERYRSRGFTSLQIGFGCTGGQHRSVYCAEAMTRILKEKFPDCIVELKHRELL